MVLFVVATALAALGSTHGFTVSSSMSPRIQADGASPHRVCDGRDPFTTPNCARRVYLPSKNLVACACEKCGSTSVWKHLYLKMFGKTYSEEECSNEMGHGGDVHQLDNHCWNHSWRKAEEFDSEDVMKRAFTYAVIRDPKERLVSSWKSKYACDGGGFGQNSQEQQFQKKRVMYLRKWANFDDDPRKCMDLEEFAQALVAVHRAGKEDKLDQHLWPQAKWCFDKYKPSEWSAVVTLSAEDAFMSLNQHLNLNATGGVHEHATLAKVPITESIADALDRVTAQDYELLGDYLVGASPIVAGAEV